jgi:hypothetical protein
MSTTVVSARTAGLKASRAKDSQDKRARALAAIGSLEAGGQAVTFTAVAEAAGVSTWLVYSPGIREHVEAGRRRQASRPPAAVPDASQAVTSVSLRADLAAAHQQIKRLRAEQDKLTNRLRLQLGAEIEGPDRAQLITRVAELEATNRQLVAERDARVLEAEAARRHITELDDDLTAARESLRQVIRSENRGRPT